MTTEMTVRCTAWGKPRGPEHHPSCCHYVPQWAVEYIAAIVRGEPVCRRCYATGEQILGDICGSCADDLRAKYRMAEEAR